MYQEEAIEKLFKKTKKLLFTKFGDWLFLNQC